MKQLIHNLSFRKFGWLGLGVMLVALLPQSAQSSHWWWRSNHQGDIVNVLEKDGRFNTLLTALEVAGLKETVATGGPFTLLAPTDEAFAKIPSETLDAILQNQELLTSILLYHVIGSKESSLALLYQSTATTLQGNPVLAVREGYTLKVNGNTVVTGNMRASNGIIHALDGVLLPPEEEITINSVVDILKLDGRFTTLLTALDVAGLTDAAASLESLTLFAPTDAAFAALPEGALEGLLQDTDALTQVLLYHVLGQKANAVELLKARTAETLQGDDVTIRLSQWQVLINDSVVINPNVRAPNGLIHTIDAVLLPPVKATSVLDLLESDGRFTTLLTALELTGLDAVLAGEGPFTIFAPTDSAFAALPEGVLESLIANPEALTQILLYHVVGGDKSSSDLLAERRVTTVQGSDVYVWRFFWSVYVNQSRVIDANLEADNGTVHAINKVLLPPTE